MFFSRRFILSQVFLSCIGLLLFFYFYKLNHKSNLPVYGNVADFKLIDQNNIPRTIDDFKNKIWVADFIFTSCSGICPTMSKRMMALHQAFMHYPDVRMVSISVNPEDDSSRVLQDYAKKHKAQGDRWIFLTGKREEIQKLAMESFKMGDMKEIVFHSSYFALVDRQGRIRGYYDGMDESRIKQLYKDLPQLEKE